MAVAVPVDEVYAGLPCGCVLVGAKRQRGPKEGEERRGGIAILANASH